MERNVSLSSGTKVCRALRARGHQAVLVDLYLGLEDYEGSLADLFDAPDGLCSDYAVAPEEPDLGAVRDGRAYHSASLFGKHVIEVCELADMVFLALHGQCGEDGRVQAAFDLLGIPYTGSGYLGSAIAMDKDLTKRLVADYVTTPRWRCVTYSDAEVERLARETPLPCVVKPIASGSSIGVSIARDVATLRKALRECLAYGNRVVLEQYVEGREIQVAVLAGRALPSIEIIPRTGFYDYANKYQAGAAEEITPAPIPPEWEDRLKKATETVFRLLGLSVYARADFIVTQDGTPYFLEINTLPGMTPTSLVPQEAAAVGMSYEDLCETILSESLKARKNPNEWITLGELSRAVGGEVLSREVPLSLSFRGVTTDSRAVKPGELFVPIVGERFDGHDYIEKALAAGASGCLCARAPERMMEGKFYVKVPDTLLAYKDLAAWYRGQFELPVVQVTGSVGKTTTKEMIAGVLGEHTATLKTEANYNNEIGTPMTLLHLKPTHGAAVIETGMDRAGQIRYLGEMVKPTVAVITNIGDMHIEYLGSRQGILAAKCEIFENLAPNGLVVLNGDDELLNTVTLPQRILRVGLGENCDVRVSDVEDRGIDGIRCTVTTKKRRYALSIPAPGAHMVYPAAMAAAIGEELGLLEEEIVRGVSAYQPAGARMRVVQCPEGRRLLDDCYNAGPQSMAAALRVLAQSEGKRVAVLGDMAELGEKSSAAHREMGELARALSIPVIAIGERAKDLAASAGDDAQWFATVEEAMDAVRAAFAPDTAMLVKASHSMHFERISEELTKES